MVGRGFHLDACYCLHLLFSHAVYHLWFQCSGQMSDSSWLHRWIITLRQCLLNRTQFYKIFRNFITALWTEQETKEGTTQETVIQSKIDILYSESLNFYKKKVFLWLHEQKKVVENTIHLRFSLAYYKCDFTFGQRKII